MTEFAIVKWRKAGDTWPCLSAFFESPGRRARDGAAAFYSRLETDESVVWKVIVHKRKENL